MKTAIISGSSSGIGKAISKQLLEKGWRVIGLARDHKKFGVSHKNYYPKTVDFADINTLESTLKTIKKEYESIDAIICSAGYGLFGELEQLSVAQMQKHLNVNFLSQVILIKVFITELKRQQSGKIIIIGSEAALNGAKKGSLYCAAKFALRGFCQSLRQECASANVGVSLVNPGMVDTPFFDTLNFAPKDRQQNAIATAEIVNVVETILKTSPQCVIEEINLQPIRKNIEKNNP